MNEPARPSSATLLASVTLRPAGPGDARAVDRLLADIFTHAPHMITRPEEFRGGLWRRRRWLARKQHAPLETCLLAVAGHEPVALLESWADRRRRVRHVTGFFMAVAEPWRGRGVGTALLRSFLDWVSTHDTLAKIELHVNSDNIAARRLYTRLGFIEEGRRRGAVRYDNGHMVDDILMACWPASGDTPRAPDTASPDKKAFP